MRQSRSVLIPPLLTDAMPATGRVQLQLPTFLGCWVLIGICAASMSTSDGAILAISTVLSHNVARKVRP